MTLTKKQKYWLWGTLGFGATSGILLAIFWKKIFPPQETCPNGKPVPADGDCTKVMTKQQVDAYNQDVSSYTQPSQQGSAPACQQPAIYQDETFPLAKGMHGEKTKVVQKKVGAQADGFFGCATQGLVFKKYGVTEISEELYNKEFA